MQRENNIEMANTVIVKIPNVSEEVRIGYSFNYMIKVMAETEAAEVVQWDFADVTFLHPFFLHAIWWSIPPLREWR